MTILAIETSASPGSIAVVRDGETVLATEFSLGRADGTPLFQSLAEARRRFDRCDRIVVGLGPGSYSGIRIAIAAAIGLRCALQAQLLGVVSVAALPAPAYYAVGDARRGAFYFAEVRAGVCCEGPCLLTREEVLAKTGALPVFVPAPIDWLPQASVRQPHARDLACLAAAGKSIVARDHLEPLYLREAHITQPKPVPGLG